MAKKKVIKKVKVREVLTETEMLKFDVHHQKEKVKKAKIAEMELKKKVAMLEYKLLDRDISLSHLRDNVERKPHLEFVKLLKEELQVNELGYNPDTGEVFRE